MSAELDHVELANRNHQALKVLLPTSAEVPEWIATVSFYKAVQVAEAVFSAQPFCQNSSNHHSRLTSLKDARLLGGKLATSYNPLMTASMLARYLRADGVRQSFRDYLPPDRIIDRLVKKRLRTFEQHAVGLLSDEGRDKLVTLDKDPEIDLKSPTGLRPGLGFDMPGKLARDCGSSVSA
ncbi:hypothetical protein [Alienimonas chondri]|uniref:hypothetical protein n=1 Tax=Alienimonas chondri TaxID=2681879 RepID=UPI0014893773|nr:hypothetical protein [Alienimonas chondri]